jgi:hypothetical protein
MSDSTYVSLMLFTALLMARLCCAMDKPETVSRWHSRQAYYLILLKLLASAVRR